MEDDGTCEDLCGTCLLGMKCLVLCPLPAYIINWRPEVRPACCGRDFEFWIFAFKRSLGSEQTLELFPSFALSFLSWMMILCIEFFFPALDSFCMSSDGWNRFSFSH